MANTGTRAEYKLAMNTFRLEIKRGFLTTTAIRVWRNPPVGTEEQNKSNCFKLRFSTLMKGEESNEESLGAVNISPQISFSRQNTLVILICGFNSWSFTPNLPRDYSFISAERSLAGALTHKGSLGTIIPPKVGRCMHPEGFFKSSTWTRKEDFTHSPYSFVSLNAVALQIQPLSSTKASELLIGAW